MMNLSPRSLKARRSRTVTAMARASFAECTALVARKCTPPTSVRGGGYHAPRGPAVKGRLVRWGLPLLLPQGAVRPEEEDLREYEMMLIVPAEADDQVIGGVTDRISQVLSARGGRITHVDRWGRR